MAFFQQSVLNKHMKAQQAEPISIAWQKFVTYFHDPVRQQNIYNAKEEQFQEGFLRELFVNILGYTLNPEPEYNLTTELKNEVGAKKADGAILKDGKALGVIELKGTDTRDLDKINEQAFSYKNNQTGCVYVITSNFEKLRFFVHNAVDHIEFNLFTLTEDEFRVLWLCLQVDNLLNGIPLKVKEESLLAEEDITKQLYKDYSSFRTELWQNLVSNNPDNDHLLLFKKTQKLLDRFLFIFFAEDSGLLPPNSISRIIKRWETLKEEDAYKPLYDIFKQYFGYINTGRKGKVPQDDIYAYNGGLFQDDLVLDSITIDDAVLFPHVMKLTGYDFQSEVDVNILGHIFENSLNETENITAQLEGQEVDKSKTKRKKDGVYYTPKYITKYIVDNTVGKLCEEKKEQLNITDDRFTQTGKRTGKGIADLQAYREWLLDLKICDPACGSGAFLNQALDFLIKEHQYLDELTAQYHKSPIVLSDIETQILENNLYGVDINEESVEIARLSLWLRTAERGRKLTSLNHNIKCGNSLIDDPEIAGEKAFKWRQEFPEVFEKGGFDVVIGNPPYVTRGLSKQMKESLNANFKTAQYQLDLYIAFIERGVGLIRAKGYFSYIVPNSWLKNMMMSECRRFILENLDMKVLVTNLENVFSDASVDTMIFTAIKQGKSNTIRIAEFRDHELFFRHFVSQKRFLDNDGFIFDIEVSEEILPIVEKMNTEILHVGDIFDVSRGINPYDIYTGQSPEIIKSRAYHADNKKDETFVPELKGLHVSRYSYLWDSKHYISYGDWLAAPRDLKYFTGPRIVFREILGRTLVSTLITEDFKIDRSLYIAKIEDAYQDQFDVRYVLGILNSTVMAFYFRYTNNEFDNLFPKIRVAEFKKLPIKKTISEDQKRISDHVEHMLSTTKEFNSMVKNFIDLLQNKFDIVKLTKKIQIWYELEFKIFLKEIKKAEVHLSLSDEAEWMQYFNEQKQEALEMKSEINRVDAEIDQMVYELYGLTEKEIRIVEGG